MHHISEVKILNFKSIKNGLFCLSPYTPLVGYNNAGKTNILQSINWIIKRSSLPGSDFFDRSAAVVVEVEICGLVGEVLDAIGATHRGRIEPLIADGKIRIRRSQSEPGQTVTGIRLEVLTREKGAEEWVVSPTGIDQAIAALFPEPIFIGAMENATEDVAKFGASTTIGKLLREIITPITERHSGPVSDALHEISKKLSASGEGKDETLVDLDHKIQKELTRIFPGVSAKTHIPTPDFSDFMKSATIKIFEDKYDNPEGRDVSSFGHGAQRSIQIALVKCLSEIKRSAGGAKGRTTLLLIDEPELYLHPQAIEVVRSALSSLSSDGYQVIFTTHSAGMIARADAPNALLIRRSVSDGTTCYPRIRDAVSAAISDANHQSETLFSISNSNKILFSERVVIVEGRSELTIMPDIFQAEFGISPGEMRIGIVDIGGSGNIVNALTVLGAMGIPAKAIADLDFAFKLAVVQGLIDSEHPAICGCKRIFVRLKENGKLELDTKGLPMKHNGISAEAAYGLMAEEDDARPFLEELHDHLLKQGIWIWNRGAIEAHLGLPNKKTSTQMDFVNKLKNPSFLSSVPDYKTVRDALDWIKN